MYRYVRTVGGVDAGRDCEGITVTAAGVGLTRCIVLQPTSISLTARDSTGQPVSVGQAAFSTRVSTITGKDLDPCYLLRGR